MTGLTVLRAALPHATWARAVLMLVALQPLCSYATDSAPSPVANPRAQAVADADEVAKALLEVRRYEVELNCTKAVENARYGVETMLEVGEKNVRGGYMKAEQFNAAATPLRALLPNLTQADCDAAGGNKRAFYQCMSSDYNHVLACAKAYPFGPGTEHPAASIVHAFPPKYPREWADAGDTGQVVVMVQVSAAGKVSAEVEKSSRSRRLDTLAVETISQWKFRPAVVDGKPVDSALRIPMEFSSN